MELGQTPKEIRQAIRQARYTAGTGGLAPGYVQVELRLGHVGPGRQTEAYHVLLTLNALLGGQFTSRINRRLRQEKGVTYGARTSFDFRRLAGSAFQLVVVAVADEQDGVALARELYRFQVNLCNQRAGGVNHAQPPRRRHLAHRRRDTVGAEDEPRAFGDFLQMIDEDGALGGQLAHHIAVVHDFVQHVDGRAVGLQR